MATARKSRVLRTIPFVIAICFICTATQAKYSGGTGEPNDPYQIATAEDLISLGKDTKDYDKHFILTADIDLDPNLPGRKIFDEAVIASDINDVRNFQGVAFTGSVNGNSYVIKNLIINNDVAEYIGLFGWIDSPGQVRNLSLENILITGYSRIGGLAGYSDGTIINCSTSGSIFSKKESNSIGGLVGSNSGYIIDCHANTNIEGGDDSSSIGGLVGRFYELYGSSNSSIIKKSSASGTIHAGQETSLVGGLVGNLFDSVIKDCYSEGMIISENGSGSIGGLTGKVNNGNISQCYSSVTVTCNNNNQSVGGLVGRTQSSVITNCYATGTVSGYRRLGGLIGYLSLGSTIKNCYASGYVSSSINSPSAGGLFGETALNYIYINQCFWDIETSGQTVSAGGTGLSTNEMHNITTYQSAGWDMANDRKDGIADIWKMPEGGGYPELTIFTKGYEPHILVGKGTPESPYQIASPEDLAAILHYDTTSYYILINDIDFSGITWAAAPIPEFNGTFDGNSHIISNLTISIGANDSRIGLFGSNKGYIHNLGLENISITAGDDSCYIGGLAGSISGDIVCCYVTGNISGANRNRYIGGLVGYQSYRDVIYCYSKCNISFGSNAEKIGGLVGNNLSGTITQCFASGSITYRGSSIDLGGLVGSSSYTEHSVRNCFWNVETSGLSTSDGGTGLTSDQMHDPNIFIDAGWDFAHRPDGPSDIWAQPVEGGYPILWWQLPESLRPLLSSFSGGTGEPDNPYLISNRDELNSIGYNPKLMNAHFKLTDNIDLADYTFYIIGNETFPFSGVFDGDGHTVSNFNYTSTSKSYIGLFEYVDGPYAEIKNLRLTDPNVVATKGVYLYINSVGSLIGQLENGKVTGCHVQGGSISGSDYYDVGGLVGLCYGIISDCNVSCTVLGTEYVGGLSGGGWRSIITDCHTACCVSGTESVGGLLGGNGGIVTGCSSSGDVSGNDTVGGLLGRNSGEIIHCCSTADVLSTGSCVGGLVGDNTGTISNSYATGSTSGNNIVGGLVGINGYINKRDVYWEAPGEISNCYSTGSVSGILSIGGLVGFNEVGSLMFCFWDIETSGVLNTCGDQNIDTTGCDDSFSKTTAEMQTVGTFLEAGWDFVGETDNGIEDIWWIDEGRDYPHLWWEPTEVESD